MAAVLANTMYFLVNTLSVVATDVTLTVTLVGTSMTAESAAVLNVAEDHLDCWR